MENKKFYNVVAAVIYSNGEILCMQRGKGKSPSTDYKWEFPGGKIEPGENPQQTLIRELREEMDYDVIPIRLLTKVEHEYPDFNISLEAWLCKVKSRKFRQKEHIDHKWMKANDLLTLDFSGADVDV